MYVLGIDGGGTRTTGIVADEHGNVHMHAVTGRSNPNTLQQAEFEEVICGLVRELKRQNDAIFTQALRLFCRNCGRRRKWTGCGSGGSFSSGAASWNESDRPE